jgi:hypothetical protein
VDENVTHKPPNSNITGESVSYSNAPESAAYASNSYVNVIPESIVAPIVPVDVSIDPSYVPTSFPISTTQPVPCEMIAKTIDFDNLDKTTVTDCITTKAPLSASLEGTDANKEDSLLENETTVRYILR